MPRLPQPGSDEGQWGDILNDFLTQSHQSNGSLKAGVVGAPQLASQSVTTAALADDTITEAKLALAVRTKLNTTSTPGPKGDKGDKGDQGDEGPQGEQGIQGIQGVQGEPGAPGADGAKGDKGDKGDQGDPGTPGAAGEKGDKGDDGKSAYQIALDDGFVGTESQWLASLKGDQGDPGAPGADGEKGDKGDQGDPGTTSWDGLTDKPTTFAPTAHAHLAADISDSTTTGRALVTAADQAAARSAIGAGTSSLAIGTTAGTAAAGDHTHANYLPIKSGVSNLTHSINDSFARVNITDDGSNTHEWPDRLAFYFNGTRSGYFNEYGEIRARPAKVNTVAMRAMKWSGSSTVDIFQVSNSDNTQTYLGVGPTRVNVTLPIESDSNITTTGVVTASNISGNKVTASVTPPSSPAVGDIWVDMSV